MAKTPKSGTSRGSEDASMKQPKIQYPRRTERRRRTRAAILKAAGDHFRKEGYAATTMQAIADSADVHVTTLFMHFKTKADLALALVQDRTDALRKRAFEARGSTGFFAFFRQEALDRAKTLAEAKKPETTFWNALQTDADLAFASASFNTDQTDIFGRFVAEEFGLDREEDYRPDLVALLLLAATDLAYQKWINSDRRADPVKEISGALDTAEPAARQMLGLKT